MYATIVFFVNDENRSLRNKNVQYLQVLTLTFSAVEVYCSGQLKLNKKPKLSYLLIKRNDMLPFSRRKNKFPAANYSVNEV